MLTEYDLIPLLWVKELTGQKFSELDKNLKADAQFRRDLHHKVYLLQEVTGASLNLNFKWDGTLFSPGLQLTLMAALDPIHEVQVSKYLGSAQLKDSGREKIASVRKLAEPPKYWVGDCQPIWLKGEAYLLYFSQFETLKPFETFRERAISRLVQKAPGIPQPLADAAYDRLTEFDAFKFTTSSI